MTNLPKDDRLERYHLSREAKPELPDLPLMTVEQFRHEVDAFSMSEPDPIVMRITAATKPFIPILPDTPNYLHVLRRRVEPFVLGAMGVDAKHVRPAAIVEDEAALSAKQSACIEEVTAVVTLQRKMLDQVFEDLYDRDNLARRMMEHPRALKQYDIMQETIVFYEKTLSELPMRFRSLYYLSLLLHENPAEGEKQLLRQFEWFQDRIETMKMFVKNDLRVQ